MRADDYEELKRIMVESYITMPNSYWKENHIQALINKFPLGQVVILANGDIAGCALSIIVDYSKLGDNHTYREATKNYTFDSNTEKGDYLYGIDVFVAPEYRGLRLGRRLYDYRKELCEQLNLKGMVFGATIINMPKSSHQKNI